MTGWNLKILDDDEYIRPFFIVENATEKRTIMRLDSPTIANLRANDTYLNKTLNNDLECYPLSKEKSLLKLILDSLCDKSTVSMFKPVEKIPSAIIL